MNSLAFIAASYGRQLVATLCMLSEWTALLLVGAFVLDRLLARRVNASWRIALYSPLLLRVALPGSWTLAFAHVPRAVTLLTPVPVTLPPPVALGYAEPSLGWPAAALVGYAAVTLALAYRIMWRRAETRRVLADAVPISGELAHLALPCPLVGHPSAGPMVIGLLQPRIVLPSDLVATGDAVALATVLRHETAHVVRRDPWLAAAMQLVLIVFWPVLPLWAASWRVRQLMEVACDESALAAASPSERRHYGHTLLDLAELRSFALTPMSTELHFGSTLRARIEALAWTRRWPLAVQIALVGAVAVAFGACSSVAVAPRDHVPLQGEAVTVGSKWVAPTAEDFALSSGRAPVPKYCGAFFERLETGLPHTSDEFRTFGPDWVATIARRWMALPADDLPADQVAFCRSPSAVLAVEVTVWADEARNGLGQIGKDSAAAFEKRRDRGDPTLCPSAPPIPNEQQAANTPHVQTTPREWNDGAGFECLRFSYSMPTYFQYRMDNDPTHLKATAHAQRTIEGHLVDLTVTLRGEVHGREFTIAPTLEETWKTVD